MIQIQPFENQDTDQIVDLILTIQQKEFFCTNYHQ